MKPASYLGSFANHYLVGNTYLVPKTSSTYWIGTHVDMEYGCLALDSSD